MADNDQNNDEYKFVELDGLDNDMMDGMEHGEAKEHSAAIAHEDSRKDIKRNALIAIAVIIILMLMYKVIGYLFFSENVDTAQKNTTTDVAVVVPKTTPTVVQPEPVVVPVTPQPVQQPVVASENYTELNRKVSAIELSQQNVRSDMSNVSQQVGSVNSNINNLNNEIASLNQVIKGLSEQLAKQTEEINILMARTQPKRVTKTIIKSTTPALIYYIQAVIPGRAWLIGTNGSTLTVREGTRIEGYGVVKLIDPLQGRVVTSSGQVIRFSQEDS